MRLHTLGGQTCGREGHGSTVHKQHTKLLGEFIRLLQDPTAKTCGTVSNDAEEKKINQVQ